MRFILLALAFNLSLAHSSSANAAPAPTPKLTISKPKSTSNANRTARNRVSRNVEGAMRGRLRLAQDAMVISQSQHRVAKKQLTNADKAHDTAEAANIAASAAYTRALADPRLSQKNKNAAKATVDKTRAARTSARNRFRNAQTIEAEVGGQLRQNTAVSLALRRGQWDLVDSNQVSRTPMVAPSLPPFPSGPLPPLPPGGGR